MCNFKERDDMQNSSIIISTFYKFVDLPNCESIKEELLYFCKNLGLKGTILLAQEGINSTIAGERESINNLYKYLSEKYGINLTNIKESYADFMPFQKTKIKLRQEIVSLKAPGVDAANDAGFYIDAQDWDNFIARDDVITIDTRNDYEVKIGTFKGAVNPNTATFRDFPQWVEENKHLFESKKIAMYCTGGIRCEKSTAFMKKLGYEDVYHLNGGILKYFDVTKNINNMWQGSCFVFDDRVALNAELECSNEVVCDECGIPLSTDDVRDTVANRKVICILCDKV
jgi:UPF0176 protein